MSNVNDLRIMELKKQIEEKKNKLNEIKKFTPITNCSIEFEGNRYNLHILQREQLIHLAIKLNSYRLAAKDIRLLDECNISGYNVEEWIVDVKAKLDAVSKKDEERNLKIMEDKLTRLLSEDKKTELEIDEIANLLK